MRLPHTVHPSPKPLALKYFAEKMGRQKELVDDGVATLPTVSLFVDFCAGLAAPRQDVVEGTVVDVDEIQGNGSCALVVMNDGRRFQGRAVVVSSSSLGHGVERVFPTWWKSFLKLGQTRAHVDEITCGDEKENHVDGMHVVIVGSGMSAATRALDVLRSSETSSVTMISRRMVVQKAFDVDQGWWGTKYLNSYEAIESGGKRLEACRRAKARGSMRAGLYDALMNGGWLESGRFRVLQGVDVQACERIDALGAVHGGKSTTKLLLRIVRHPELPKAEAMKSDIGDGPGDVVEVVCDAVEIACGSAFDVARHPVLKQVVARNDVEVLGGYPVVEADCSLYKGSRVFVAGRGATLAVGPCGGNMIGMRMCAQRICAALEGVVARGADRVTILTDKMVHAGFDPVKRVAVWTSIDGAVVDQHGADRPTPSSMLEFPLESSNALSLLPTSIQTPSKHRNPLDPANIPCEKKTKLSSYSFSDDGFRLAIMMTFPEPIHKDRVRIRVTMTSLEAWFIGEDTAYHLHVPRLYGNVLPERTAIIIKEDKNRVTIKLHKEKDVEWKFLKG